MKTYKFIRILLAVFGFLATSIGGALLFNPVTFEALAGLMLDPDVNLISEFRSFGGLLMVSGIIIALGAISPKLTYLSVWCSCLVYSSIGLSRLIGIIIDGIPAESMLLAMFVELVIGVVCLGILLKLRRQRHLALKAVMIQHTFD